MKTISIKTEKRELSNKAAVKALRKDEKIPGVFCNNGESQAISMGYEDAESVLFTADTYIVELELDGQTYNCLVREAQYHPVTDRITHIDFMALRDGKEIELQLPVILEGTPVGVGQGGKLLSKMRKLTVKGVPIDLPEHIVVDVTNINLGFSIKVSDLDIEGLNITTGGSAAIASVEIPRAVRSAASAEGEEGEEGEEGAEGEAEA